MKSEVLVLLSGGIDSTACLNFFLEMGRPTCCMFINYEQSAVQNEIRSARAIADYYSVDLLSTKWKGINNKSTGLINGRNSFLLSAALMERPETISIIAIGIHSGTNYPDCSTKFLQNMQSIVDLYNSCKVHLSAPFINFSKEEILSYCIEKEIPLELTYSCERGGTTPCGECLSCKDREMLNACKKKNIKPSGRW